MVWLLIWREKEIKMLKIRKNSEKLEKIRKNTLGKIRKNMEIS